MKRSMKQRKPRQKRSWTENTYTTTLPVLRGQAVVQMIGGYGNWRARCENLNLERSHRTQEGALTRLKMAIDERAAGQFALPFNDV